MENNINQQIENEHRAHIQEQFEELQRDITNEVKEKLASQNITVIPNDYQPGHELVNIINEYNSKMKQLNEQIEYNTETYKQAKADTENYLVRADIQDLKRETEDKLDNILTKQQLLQEQGLKDEQNSPTYKEAKAEALNIVSLLSKCEEIPTDLLMDTLAPSIAAGDVKTLELCKVLLQKNFMASYTVERAIDGVNDLLANTELALAVDSMKDYVRTGKDGLTYYMYLHKYQ